MLKSPCEECPNKVKTNCKCMEWRKYFLRQFREIRRIFIEDLPPMTEEEADQINRRVSYGERKTEK